MRVSMSPLYHDQALGLRCQFFLARRLQLTQTRDMKPKIWPHTGDTWRHSYSGVLVRIHRIDYQGGEGYALVGFPDRQERVAFTRFANEECWQLVSRRPEYVPQAKFKKKRRRLITDNHKPIARL